MVGVRHDGLGAAGWVSCTEERVLRKGKVVYLPLFFALSANHSLLSLSHRFWASDLGGILDLFIDMVFWASHRISFLEF